MFEWVELFFPPLSVALPLILSPLFIIIIIFSRGFPSPKFSFSFRFLPKPTFKKVSEGLSYQKLLFNFRDFRYFFFFTSFLTGFCL